ncbi:MAG: hypothetical protein AAFV77_11390 [Planctomycetota bacterium]
MNLDRAQDIASALVRQMIEAGAHGAVVYMNFGGGNFVLDWGPHDDNLIAACRRIADAALIAIDGEDEDEPATGGGGQEDEDSNE